MKDRPIRFNSEMVRAILAGKSNLRGLRRRKLLTDKEHLLICLAEECAEVQHAVAKALRFGLDDGYPGSGATNAEDLQRECRDMVAIIELLEEIKAVPCGYIGAEAAINQKKEKVRAYMDYAREKGQLEPAKENGHA